MPNRSRGPDEMFFSGRIVRTMDVSPELSVLVIGVDRLNRAKANTVGFLTGEPAPDKLEVYLLMKGETARGLEKESCSASVNILKDMEVSFWIELEGV